MRPLTGSIGVNPGGSGCLLTFEDEASRSSRTPFPPSEPKGARGFTPHLEPPIPEVRGIQEEETGIDTLLHESPETILLDPVNPGAGKEAAASLLSLPLADEALDVASGGPGGGTADPGEEERDRPVRQPLSHLLATEGLLHPVGGLEEEDPLDGVAVEAAVGNPRTKGLEEAGLGSCMKLGRDFAEVQGLERFSRRGELAEQRCGCVDCKWPIGCGGPSRSGASPRGGGSDSRPLP